MRDIPRVKLTPLSASSSGPNFKLFLRRCCLRFQSRLEAGVDFDFPSIVTKAFSVFSCGVYELWHDCDKHGKFCYMKRRFRVARAVEGGPCTVIEDPPLGEFCGHDSAQSTSPYSVFLIRSGQGFLFPGLLDKGREVR